MVIAAATMQYKKSSSGVTVNLVLEGTAADLQLSDVSSAAGESESADGVQTHVQICSWLCCVADARVRSARLADR